MSLLFGDGSTPATAVVRVPLMDDPDPALFSGEFSSTVERAVEVLSAFLNGFDLDALGSWFDL